MPADPFRPRTPSIDPFGIGDEINPTLPPEAAARRDDLLRAVQRIGRKVDAGEPVEVEVAPDAWLAQPGDDVPTLLARWRSAWDSEPVRLQSIGPDPTFATVYGAVHERDVADLAGRVGIVLTGPELSEPIVDELDEWRTTYGRLDIPVRLIDWRPIAAGIAALTLAAAAHWIATRRPGITFYPPVTTSDAPAPQTTLYDWARSLDWKR